MQARSLQILFLACLVDARSQPRTTGVVPVQRGGLAWLYHEGRVFCQTESEDKLTAIRLVDDDQQHNQAGKDAIGEECFGSDSRIRLLVDQEQVIDVGEEK